VKNITISLSEEMAHQAKILAAEKHTSVSRFVGELLAERVGRERTYAAASRRWTSRKPMMLNESGSPYPTRDDLHDR
jgi:hypothetical protein